MGGKGSGSGRLMADTQPIVPIQTLGFGSPKTVMHDFAQYIAEYETKLDALISKISGGPVATIVGTFVHELRERLLVFMDEVIAQPGAHN